MEITDTHQEIDETSFFCCMVNLQQTSVKTDTELVWQNTVNCSPVDACRTVSQRLQVKGC